MLLTLAIVYVVAELDYLVATGTGWTPSWPCSTNLPAERGTLAALDGGCLRRARGTIARYRDEEIGVADASVVVLAGRYRTRTIASLDRWHFHVLRPLDCGCFEVLLRAG